MVTESALGQVIQLLGGQKLDSQMTHVQQQRAGFIDLVLLETKREHCGLAATTLQSPSTQIVSIHVHRPSSVPSAIIKLD